MRSETRQSAVLYAMAKMAESHDGEKEDHLRRMQEYVRALAENLQTLPNWCLFGDRSYLAELLQCVPLHDIGKIGVPDALRTKTAELTQREWAAVQAHTLTGSEILESVARKHGDSLTFLAVARSIVRHHHERWDGTGYPDRLAGESIPHAARLVALADAYDAIRRDKADRPGVPHVVAVSMIANTEGQFDPAVVTAFRAVERQFEEIYLSNSK